MMIYFSLFKDKSIKNSEKGKFSFGTCRKEHEIIGNMGFILSIKCYDYKLNVKFQNFDKVKTKISCKTI